jgi:hypothetical protein
MYIALGLSWSLAGSAEEEAARSTRRFESKISLSGDGAPRSPVVMSSSSPSFRVCGSGEFGLPSPRQRGGRSGVSRIRRGGYEESGDGVGVRWCNISSQELATGNFPSAEARTGCARSKLVFFIGIQGSFLYFCLCSRFFCKN